MWRSSASPTHPARLDFRTWCQAETIIWPRWFPWLPWWNFWHLAPSMWWPWDLAGTAPLPNLGIASGGWTSNQEVWEHLASLNKPLLIFNDLEWVLRFALPFLSNILSETGSLKYHHLLLAPSPPPPRTSWILHLEREKTTQTWDQAALVNQNEAPCHSSPGNIENGIKNCLRHPWFFLKFKWKVVSPGIRSDHSKDKSPWLSRAEFHGNTLAKNTSAKLK